jgi:hypothetical protein
MSILLKNTSWQSAKTEKKQTADDQRSVLKRVMTCP